MITDHVPAVRVVLIMRLAGWLRLSCREETWKTAEILILRHQLAVLQRRQPRRCQTPVPAAGLPGPAVPPDASEPMPAAHEPPAQPACPHPADARDYQTGTCAACGAILWD